MTVPRLELFAQSFGIGRAYLAGHRQRAGQPRRTRGGSMMTAKQDLAKRMTAAAASRKDGRKPESRTAVRTKPVRITVDLDPAVMVCDNFRGATGRSQGIIRYFDPQP
jgi:hypothetical protein